MEVLDKFWNVSAIIRIQNRALPPEVKFKNFLTSFVSFNNLDALMKV